MTLYATRIHADTATVTVVSHDKGVASWAARYFGPWWYASGVEALGPDDSAEGDAVVFADVNPRLAGSIAELVAEDAHDETDYAGARTLVARRGSITYAVQPDEELAYQVDSRRLVVAGHQAEAVAVAAARLVRESVRGRLAQAGWTVLHASAATRDGQAVIALGGRGTGKTTTAVLLARSGWGLLANDRVFARVEHDGRVAILPWPSAAAVGLGLLDALGRYDSVRARLAEGERLHPTQHPAVTRALVDGRREPLLREGGRELKAQFFPDQLADWLGLGLSAEGRVAGLLFPKISPEATAALAEKDHVPSEADVFPAGREDRYPDVFGLLPATGAPGAAALAERLTGLPRVSVVLGHDAEASGALLAKVADELTAAG
ncbi:hypothetical protein [Streptomyces sp. CC228A]|uniref:hypothetical protein n=1 Tax=Streptomyces sp. CC228A TaxID=2898186 RepID=UPI001F467D39|nr:hypothetical protein [Streptomyces sp. CC228A]